MIACHTCLGYGMTGYDQRGRPEPCSDCNGTGRYHEPTIDGTNDEGEQRTHESGIGDGKRRWETAMGNGGWK